MKSDCQENTFQGERLLENELVHIGITLVMDLTHSGDWICYRFFQYSSATNPSFK